MATLTTREARHAVIAAFAASSAAPPTGPASPCSVEPRRLRAARRRRRGKTLAGAGWIDLPKSFKGDKSAQADEVGKTLAAAATKAGIETVVFDRGGYLYHGRVKALAEGAREGGLKF